VPLVHLSFLFFFSCPGREFDVFSPDAEKCLYSPLSPNVFRQFYLGDLLFLPGRFLRVVPPPDWSAFLAFFGTVSVFFLYNRVLGTIPILTIPHPTQNFESHASVVYIRHPLPISTAPRFFSRRRSPLSLDHNALFNPLRVSSFSP